MVHISIQDTEVHHLAQLQVAYHRHPAASPPDSTDCSLHLLLPGQSILVDNLGFSVWGGGGVLEGELEL